MLKNTFISRVLKEYFHIQGVQAGQVVEVSERHPDDHDEHGGRAVQPHLCPLHHHLHLRRHGHAALRQGGPWISAFGVGPGFSLTKN